MPSFLDSQPDLVVQSFNNIGEPDLSIERILSTHSQQLLEAMSESIASPAPYSAIYLGLDDDGNILAFGQSVKDQQHYVPIKKIGDLQCNNPATYEHIYINTSRGTKQLLSTAAIDTDCFVQVINSIISAKKSVGQDPYGPISCYVIEDKLMSGFTATAAIKLLTSKNLKQKIRQQLGHNIDIKVEKVAVVAAQARGIRYIRHETGMKKGRFGYLVLFSDGGARNEKLTVVQENGAATGGKAKNRREAHHEFPDLTSRYIGQRIDRRPSHASTHRPNFGTGPTGQ